ncbi:MAG: hypothetical protein HN893_01875 [Rhodospirillales bacterium]|nr:hypothetical protein [Rhodospirillales bacterium]
MILRTATGLVQVLAGLAAGFVIVTLVAVWMLSRGPVSLSFFEGHMTEFLHEAFPTVEIEFDDTILAWAGWNRAIDIRIINLRMATTDGKMRAEIPSASVSISAQALLHGIAAPSRVEMFGPTISVSLQTSGDFNLATASVGAVVTGRLEPYLRQLSTKPDPSDPLGYLKKLTISDADFIVIDKTREMSWVTPDAQLSIVRDGRRIDADISFLVDLTDTVADVSIVGSYDDLTERVDAGVSFNNFIPSEIATTIPELKFLEDIQFPVQGTLTIASSIDGQVDGVGVDITGDFGRIALPAYLGGDVTVDSLELRGHFDALSNQIEIATFAAHLPEGSHVQLPAPVNHTMPLSSIKLSGMYAIESDTIQIHQLDLGLNDVAVAIAGTAASVSTKPEVDIRIDVPGIDLEQLAVYWPATILEDARTWITGSVHTGKIEDIRADLRTAIDEDGNLRVVDAHGSYQLSDVSFNYVDAMPPISDLAASVQFNLDRMDFDVLSAHSAGMTIGQARVSLVDISSHNEKVSIRTSLNGSFAHAIALADRDPLGFAKQVGIDAESVSGTAVVDLAFDFPLLKDLEWEDVSASATANAYSVNIPQGLFGLDIFGGNLDIAIDRDGMDINGEMLLEAFPTVLVWRQNFSADKPFKNRYEISTHVTDVKDVTDLGIDVSPFSADMIKGAVPLSLQVTEQFDGTSVLEANAVLDSVELVANAINWRKPMGSSGKAQVTIDLVNDQISSIPKFDVQTDDLVVSGSALYDEPGGRLSRIDLDQIKYGRNDISGLLVPGGEGVWDADFRGASLDLTDVWDEVIHSDLLTSGESFLEDIGVSVQFDRVWLSEDRGVNNLTGAFARESELWETIYVTANVDSGESLEIKLTPSEKSNARILTVWSLDAGSVLRTLDIYDNMLGGELSLKGQFDDALPDQPLRGVLEVHDYRILKAPALAKAISILALTGILDALQGEGLGFDQLVLPYHYEDGILELKDAKATGASLGFTASGKVYTNANALDIDGTIVPVYVLNSLLGNIPIIGNIFSGGEEGGGLFAANYSMTGSRDDPDVSINPLSVLAPGFLRNIFSLGDGTHSGELEEPDNSHNDR